MPREQTCFPLLRWPWNAVCSDTKGFLIISPFKDIAWYNGKLYFLLLNGKVGRLSGPNSSFNYIAPSLQQEPGPGPKVQDLPKSPGIEKNVCKSKASLPRLGLDSVHLLDFTILSDWLSRDLPPKLKGR